LSSAEAATDRYGLFIGAPSRRKNIDAVLSTAIGLARLRAHRFQLVGPDVERLRAQVPSDVAHLIEFRGYIRDDELPGLYRDAAYLLFPSFYEASGLPLSEAMTFGCPIVASDLPVMRERCGEAAIYCDPHDADSIRQAVDQLLGDPARMAELRRRGPHQAAQFTWRRQAELIVEAMSADRRNECD
jgi:glycosyltransferase involved in cell wall biosynthesis